MKHCNQCQRSTPNLRRGLCDRCYMSWYKGKEKKAACECCGHADPRVLVRRRLDGEDWTTLCANCSAISGRRKMTLDDLRLEVFPPEDRRQSDARSGRSRRKEHRRAVDIGPEDGVEKRIKDRRIG